METKVQRWGNSLALRIPKAFAEELGLHAGVCVQVELSDGRLVLEPADKGAYSLDELLAQVTQENIHVEVDLGEPVGREAL